jgi:hypothetical protein
MMSWMVCRTLQDKDRVNFIVIVLELYLKRKKHAIQSSTGYILYLKILQLNHIVHIGLAAKCNRDEQNKNLFCITCSIQI